MTEISNSYKESHLLHPEWFRTFYAKIRESEKNVVPFITAQLRKDTTTKQSLAILGVGAGEGDRELPLLKNLSGGKQLSFDYLDISPDYLKIFKKKLRNEQLENILSKVTISDWRDFSPSRQYDIVLAFHSLYGMKQDVQSSLQKILACLRENGTAYILHDAREGFIPQFFQRIVGEETVTAELLEKQLIEMNALRDVQPIDCPLDLNFCRTAHGKEMGEEGRAFLSYILEKDYATYTTQEQKRIRETLDALARPMEDFAYAANNLNHLIRVHGKRSAASYYD